MNDVMHTIGAVRAPRKARKLLEQLTATRQLSAGGLKWLVVATDPFHDTEIAPDGFPDILSSRTITQCVTLSENVSSPLDDENLWDAHFFFAPITPAFTQTTAFEGGLEDESPTLKKQDSAKKIKKTVHKTDLYCGQEDDPEDDIVTRHFERRQSPKALLTPNYYRSGVNPAGGVTQSGSGLTINSGINILTVANGEDWTSASDGVQNNSLMIPLNFASGSWRLIACGYEVQNVTADLYKGGTVTCYKSPGAPSPCTLNFATGDGIGSTWAHASLVTLPPTNQPDAVLYPNSKTWKAEDGLYQVVSMSELSNPFITPLPTVAGMVTPSSYDNLVDGTGWVAYLPANGSNTMITSCTNTLPFDVCGSMFVGLNANTSLQVTARYYFERAPTAADPDLLVLARPPPSYDNMAFLIYSLAMDQLPVGCPVGENPLGEWFADVLQAIGEYAPTIGNALGNVVPGAGAIGNILGMAGRGAHRLMVKNTPRGDQVMRIQPAPQRGGGNKRKNKKQTIVVKPSGRGRKRKRGQKVQLRGGPAIRGKPITIQV